ncbi:hypothetical protein BGZ51_002340 [Haplosporangium sp. Z 767]|nr:hypothetical protein BGZ50_003530 [Haplosporangium sp. Z 11]KAF9185933.1 hypothetical protein BGZ51_002340 [Haplosporangium sp. Z 767]
MDAHGLKETRCFPFGRLPTEVQLLVMHHLASEAALLRFRLVSTQTNTLVMDPAFWHELVLTKQLYLNASTAQRTKRPNIGTITMPSNPIDPQPSLNQHNSDAYIFAHRQPQSVVLSSSNGTGPQPHSSATEHLPASGLPKARSWVTAEASFLEFVSRLASCTRTAEGVYTVVIEDWDDAASIRSLWVNLQEFSELKDLSLRNSTIERLMPTNTSMATPLHIHPEQACWAHLIRLDLKKCVRLHDLSGIHSLMPYLEDLSLEECRGLGDFRPLALSAHSTRQLFLQRLNLTHTKIQDSELIELLMHSPRLTELRLDRCYALTIASLQAIGQGHSPGPPGIQDQTDMNIDQPQDQIQGFIPDLNLTSPCPQLKTLSLKDCYDLGDEGVRALAGCRQLEFLILRGLRGVNEETVDWLHSKGVPMRRALSPLGQWRHWYY